MNDNKICLICGRTYPKESEDDICQSCRDRVSKYRFNNALEADAHNWDTREIEKEE